MIRLLAMGMLLTSGGVGGWLWWKPAPPPEAERSAQFAENGPEGAEYRWRTAQSRHWRYVVMPKK